MEPETTYYLVLAAGATRDYPSGIVRRIHTTPMPTDQYVGRDRRWHRTEYLRRYWLRHNDADHEEITAAEAHTNIDRWRAEWARKDGQA